MNTKFKLDSLLNLSKNSFNSLGYADWSTTYQSLSKAGKVAAKVINKNEKKEKSY